MHARTLLLLIVVGACRASRESSYQALLQEIKGRRINALVPPFVDDGKISLGIGFDLHRVIHLNAEKGTLTVSGTLTVAWTDSRLTWTRTDAHFLILDASQLWIPQLSLLSSSDESLLHPPTVRVSPSGRAVIQRPLLTSVSCDVDVRFFPRDVQHCNLLFLPPVGLRQLLTPVSLSAKTAESPDVGEQWTLLGTDSRIVETRALNSSGGMSQFPGFQVSLLLARNNNFYLLTLLIPSFMLAGLMLVPFLLPGGLAQPKLMIPVTTFVSINVYMILLEKSLPKSAVLPVLGEVYATLLCVGVMAELFQAFTVKFHNCRVKEVPRPLAFIYLHILSWICCYHICHGVEHFRDRRDKEALELQTEDTGPDSDADKGVQSWETVQKQWRSISRINDRIGLMICSFILFISLVFLMVRCYFTVSIPESYRGPVEL